jgi:predicted PhzF superfamily epimerase YddE/YHI9
VKLPIYQLDAFTRRPFGGNPAAVVIMDEWLPDSVLQSIAAENNLAETAFVIAKGEACPLRWFTPAVEIDLCGHATLATADVLFRERFPALRRITFETLSGELVVERGADGLAMDFPSRPGRSVPVSDEIVAAVGVRPREAFMARDLMVVFDTEGQVRELHPDIARVAMLDAFAVIATAPGSEADFVSRFFAPKAGIAEDPATGSSHCTLTPYWAQRLGKTSLTARQLSARGAEMRCEQRGDRVVVSGHCVQYMKGAIEV